MRRSSTAEDIPEELRVKERHEGEDVAPASIRECENLSSKPSLLLIVSVSEFDRPEQRASLDKPSPTPPSSVSEGSPMPEKGSQEKPGVQLPLTVRPPPDVDVTGPPSTPIPGGPIKQFRRRSCEWRLVCVHSRGALVVNL